jgi:hypothetical protein
VPEHHSSDIAKQHADLYRKELLRKRMSRWGAPGAAYVPFIGDGDLAVAHYADRRIFGADIDPNRTAVAESRLPQADIRTADCDLWPFYGLNHKFGLADFDAYAYPYHSFRSFWGNAKKADRLLLYFTDGQGLNISFKGRWREPAGHEDTAPGYKVGVAAGDLNTRQRVRAFWFSKHVWPWFLKEISPQWEVLEVQRYLRGVTMLYWAAAIQRT